MVLIFYSCNTKKSIEPYLEPRYDTLIIDSVSLFNLGEFRNKKLKVHQISSYFIFSDGSDGNIYTIDKAGNDYYFTLVPVQVFGSATLKKFPTTYPIVVEDKILLLRMNNFLYTYLPNSRKLDSLKIGIENYIYFKDLIDFSNHELIVSAVKYYSKSDSKQYLFSIDLKEEEFDTLVVNGSADKLAGFLNINNKVFMIDNYSQYYYVLDKSDYSLDTFQYVPSKFREYGRVEFKKDYLGLSDFEKAELKNDELLDFWIWKEYHFQLWKVYDSDFESPYFRSLLIVSNGNFHYEGVFDLNALNFDKKGNLFILKGEMDSPTLLRVPLSAIFPEIQPVFID
jgi:hypothetical protein